MRAVVQRVKKSSVSIDGKKISEINKGYNVLLGIEKDDENEDMDYIINKLLNIRLFDDEDGKINLSIKDVCGEILVVSQFTLIGDARKGRRPSFFNAKNPDDARKMYNDFVEKLKENITVKTGEFQADMDVEIINDGPVTILLDSKKIF